MGPSGGGAWTGAGLGDRPLRTPTQHRVAVWLRSVARGAPANLGVLDDETARVLRGSRLDALAHAYGATHPTLDGVERQSFAAVALTATALGRVVEALRTAGVPTAVLKGLPLAERYWGDACLRPAGDVDLLVARADYERAREVLTGLGMVMREDGVPAWYLRRWFYHETLHGSGTLGIAVELHWDYVRPGLGDTRVSDLLAAVEPIVVAGVAMPSPAPPWQLLVAAAHAVHESFPARHLLDVALVARAMDEAQWRAAVDIAAEARLGPTLWYGVRASADWLDWEPAPALERLRPSPARDAVVVRYVRRLPPFGRASRVDRQLQHLLAPALSSAGARAVTRIPYGLLTDRNTLVLRGERARLRLLQAVRRAGRSRT